MEVCLRCQAHVADGVRECERCGHPLPSSFVERTEYKFMLTIGTLVMTGGAMAAVADARIAAILSTAVGAGFIWTGVSGLRRKDDQ